MLRIRVAGGRKLNGCVEIQGSKNAALPILAATVLTDGKVTIDNCPDISDTEDMRRLLKMLGISAARNGARLEIDSRYIKSNHLCCGGSEASRSAVFFMSVLLARFGRAVIPYPGGCAIGKRPIDIHISALKKMGACIAEIYDSTLGKHLDCAADRLKGADITLPFPSVGATENILLAAVTAEGITRIFNYAKEPEIDALCDFLNAVGADIHKSSKTLVINGVDKLKSVSNLYFRLPGDRIVAGTYMLLVAAAGGAAKLNGINPQHLQCLNGLLVSAGCIIDAADSSLEIKREGELRAVGNVITEPYPGFPTDLQSQLIAAMIFADGETKICESIFEDRYKVVPELCKLGADIEISNEFAKIKGKKEIYGALVNSSELRGGAALVIAGAAACGETIVCDNGYIKRGYEDICRDVKTLGGEISFRNGD